MSDPGETPTQKRERLKEKPISNLGNYEITLRIVPTQVKGKDREQYVVRSVPDGERKNIVGAYEQALTLAVELQEKAMEAKPPTGYEKTFLIGICDLKLYRTVRKSGKGELAWLYTLENSQGEVLSTSDRFWDVSVYAVSLAVNELNLIKRREEAKRHDPL